MKKCLINVARLISPYFSNWQQFKKMNWQYSTTNQRRRPFKEQKKKHWVHCIGIINSTKVYSPGTPMIFNQFIKIKIKRSSSRNLSNMKHPIYKATNRSFFLLYIYIYIYLYLYIFFYNRYRNSDLVDHFETNKWNWLKKKNRKRNQLIMNILLKRREKQTKKGKILMNSTTI